MIYSRHSEEHHDEKDDQQHDTQNGLGADLLQLLDHSQGLGILKYQGEI